MSNLHLLITEMFLPYMPQHEAEELATDIMEYSRTEEMLHFNIWDSLTDHEVDFITANERVADLIEQAKAGGQQLALAA